MTEYFADTIQGLLTRGAADAPAIGAPGRTALTYAGLRTLAARTTETLGKAGIGRGDRVAIVLPNGPEMAASFIAVAHAATTAPLNPAYKEEEFDFYLSDLNAKALVIQRGMESPARIVAARRSIPVIELDPIEASGAGDFSLALPEGLSGEPSTAGIPQAEDIALVLHTSGTTSRPKIVPLRQVNVSASAIHIAETLALTPNDVCLNIMPLFHIHGLIAATLSSLAAGASVVATPGFNAFKFFSWFSEANPSWYTAVPTMHQAILGLAGRNKDTIARSRLRFIRSSSSSLPPQVMKDLEDAFSVPVLEAYGMTEAAHQMCSNPLPPRAHYAGSVGIAAGPEVGIMDDDGTILGPNQLGEVVIRGRNVTAGYENNPDANLKGFHNGWFRTGDQGKIDEAGYLWLTGRIKEIINRGGEKFSPLEVDNVVMEHPAVQQCLTFAIPHDKLGEEAGLAIVLHEGQTADEHQIRDYLSQRLAAFKVPRKIVFLTEIPKGATGKLQRIGLAEKLGLTA
ncbi:acyl--CoA ligase [Granulibacter bethesdensis]|uniref:Acyl-CoA synthetase family protein n=1 Tax=Granulibacter bethesdensis (strain ATCC BAA-1260 / CGDNIH1) TaxID=391165 RepID=Q0BU14_GRABC|nr:acyl--CoA ligase [Granulibacter bethesdensis]ABI61688.1 Acyl-CoA synthetase family protein [Granulibacter bethesdensis CGDNIH1]APH51494.1 Acyl-CoA synthetase family protein [Granulibacter bethesdensis]APH64187.1 Acyl-CoA synthetase family protein [Granulibacter bethesdensis]